MKSTIIKAPSKVNLYLDVINKRADGYHNIETVFERIDLCDWIKISVISKGIKITCEQGLFTPTFNNTAYKAAKVLCERYNLNCGFRIKLDKRIPIAAGLGGGSSDAAGVLLGINNLLDIKLKKKILLKLAVGIGADVPFFISGYKRAFATGIGENLAALNQKQRMHFLLVVPFIRIPTSSVYNRLDASTSLSINPERSQKTISLNLTKKKTNVNIFRYYIRHLAIGNINNVLFNRLEEVVLPSYPALRNIKEALKKAGAEGILVSGSGSAVYGIFSSRKEAVRAENRLRKEGDWQLFLATSY